VAEDQLVTILRSEQLGPRWQGTSRIATIWQQREPEVPASAIHDALNIWLGAAATHDGPAWAPLLPALSGHYTDGLALLGAYIYTHPTEVAEQLRAALAVALLGGARDD
jgi:hypothetical protein